MIFIAIFGFFSFLVSLLFTILMPVSGFVPFDFTTVIGTWLGDAFAFAIVFWPLQPVAFAMAAYIPLKVGLMVMRFILGARAPDAS